MAVGRPKHDLDGILLGELRALHLSPPSGRRNSARAERDWMAGTTVVSRLACEFRALASRLGLILSHATFLWSRQMRFVILCLAVVFSLSASRVAMAAADMHYDQNTGMIWIHNNTGGALASASLISRDGLLTTPSAMLSIPGTTKDDSEFPFALTYLGVPVGFYQVGLVVQPRIWGAGDLRFEYRERSLLEPVSLGEIFFVPEPSTLALATCGLGGLAWRRGRLKRV